MRLPCVSINVRERPWASKRQPIDYKRCCTDRLNPHPRPSHYALSLLTAAAGAAFAMRQILLHIMPGDPGYGSALLGYHYYTWAFIGFAVAIIALAVALLLDEQFRDDGKPQPRSAFARAAVWLVIALTALNVVS